jgi:hypothetical protein
MDHSPSVSSVDMSLAQSSKSPKPVFYLKTVIEETDPKPSKMEMKVTMNEEKITASRPRSETTSDGISPTVLKTLDRLLATFVMTGSWTDEIYKSPNEKNDVKVDPGGNMQFLITNSDRRDIGLSLLLGTLTSIHQMCMLIRIRDQRALRTGKHNAIASRCQYVDLFELSWSIQSHLFTMHKMGVRYIVMGMNNTLCVDKNTLLLLVRDSLTRTGMSKENAYWAFNTIATTIAKEL